MTDKDDEKNKNNKDKDKKEENKDSSKEKDNVINLDDFRQKLWKTADSLRAQMDAAEYKHIVLGLIFLKYISKCTCNKPSRYRKTTQANINNKRCKKFSPISYRRNISITNSS